MNLEPFRVLFEDAETRRELAAAEKTIAELRHMVTQLDIAIANYRDTLNTLSERTS